MMTHRERGWTLIELIVGMIIMIIVFGMVARGVMDAFSGASGSRAGSVSDAAISRASEAFKDDVARAETDDRAAGRDRNQVELEYAVRNGTVLQSSDPSKLGPADIDEVVEATRNRLTVKADVRADRTGAECVTWAMQPSPDNKKLQFVRTVQAPCGGAVLETRTMLSAPMNQQGIEPNPFSYDLQCDRSSCPGAPSGSRCVPWTVTSVTGTRERRWIVTIRARLVAGATEGKSAGQSRSSVLAAIRSRDTTQYKDALGC